MTEQQLRQTVAENIVYYRTQSGMTQLQLAEFLNYSDKSISKWEHADGLPDVFVLHRIAELYEIDISDLLSVKKRKRPGADKKKKAFIMSLAVVFVMVVAAVVFALGYYLSGEPRFYLAFVYGIPLAAVVALVLSTVWGRRIISGISTSVIIWGALCCVWTTLYAVTGDYSNVWVFLTVAIPLQGLTILWFFFRGTLQKAKNAFVESLGKSREKRENKKADREQSEKKRSDEKDK